MTCVVVQWGQFINIIAYQSGVVGPISVRSSGRGRRSLSIH